MCIILNDKTEYNRCELPTLSVSRQRQKVINTTKTLEIRKEKDKFQEISGETQFKRRDRQIEETDSAMRETGEEIEKRRMKRPRRRDARDRTGTSMPARDIRERQKKSGETEEIGEDQKRDEETVERTEVRDRT